MNESQRPRIGLSSWKRAVKTMVGDPEQLFTLAEEYVERVRDAGGIPMILPPAASETAADTVRAIDGLVLTGGGDFDPACYGAPDEGVSSDIDIETDRWDLALAAAARDAELPFLGICRGLQALNLALGGTLHQDISGRGDHPQISAVPEEAVAFRHPVTIEPASRLGQLLGVSERSVNSIHHQAVDQLGEGLIAVAHAPDGTVEGLEYVNTNGTGPSDSDWSALAVQWHPERMEPGLDQRIFDDLVARAAARRSGAPVLATAGR